MNYGSDFAWWRMPGVEKWCRNIADDLLAPRSVFLLFPRYCPPEAVQRLSEAICDQIPYTNIHEYWINPANAKGRSPATLLADSLRWPSRKTNGRLGPRELIYSDDWPSLTVITGLEGLPPEEQALWGRFISGWNDAAHGAPSDVARRVLLFPIHGESAFTPPADVRLAVRRFWNPLSQLELTYLLRTALRESSEANWHWAEAVWTELSGGDPQLLERLLTQCIACERDEWGVLTEYGRDLGWNPSQLEKLGAVKATRLSYPSRMRNLGAPPKEFEALWRAGAIVYTPERGMELHAAAAALVGLRQELDQRIWRGQARFLFPVIDAVRFDLCRSLTRLFGEQWIHFADQDRGDLQSTPDGPITQFGHLLCVIRAPQAYFPGVDKNALEASVDILRKARNQLAHYVPLTRAVFEELLSTIQRLDNLL
ncbi:hypothetical protein GTO91_09940 [Heliobacterium undosum]|uniref:Swt1-like HEPN domain-containing protein n=1 Tax=Heliomicrobium undosum TaxID=121734 RepID=A0A845L4Q3_9FIRM|nr:hypothetical protein [Heliomicrobium undosum]MZP30025.1 hypothetical protein [Heliomicrobium undosum]